MDGGRLTELNPEVVELGRSDDLAHVRLGNGALRGASNVVRVAGVRGKVGTQFADHVLVVLVTAVALDVEVPAVNKGAAERSRHAAALRVAPCVPQVLANGLGLVLGLERVGARGTAEGKDDLDTVALAFLYGGSKVITLLRLALRRDITGLPYRPRRHRVAVTIFIEKSEDEDVDASVGGTIGREIIVLDRSAAVLAPIDNVEAAGGLARKHGRGRGGSCGHEANGA